MEGQGDRMQPQCVIVGGGISGLSAAYELQRRGVPFVLVEGSSRFGGLIRTEVENDFVIDAGPDAILTHKTGGVALCGELGVDLLPVKTPGTFVARRGALHRLPETGIFGIPTDWQGFLRTRAFSTTEKFRMAAEYFIPPLRPVDPSRDESIASFIGRRFGREAVRTIGDPLMAGIHSGRADQLSMRALFPRLLDLEEREGSVIRGIRRAPRHTAAAQSPFVCVRGGTAALVKALVAALPRESLMTCAEVRGLELGDLWRIHLASGACLEAPATLLASPPRVAAVLLRDADSPLSKRCAQVRDVSLVTVALGYERQAVRRPRRERVRRGGQRAGPRHGRHLGHIEVGRPRTERPRAVSCVRRRCTRSGSNPSRR
jgi:protoporphyrinogen/coproporphyrinogen III oxidase